MESYYFLTIGCLFILLSSLILIFVKNITQFYKILLYLMLITGILSIFVFIEELLHLFEIGSIIIEIIMK